ncbi:hypothetical protein QCA50_008657 [Cerrena zonata]|uniref:BTB domain-containing protein n=1 Tax=Cerrena zonata TaxID=2478898 RepID=A0AAW0GEB9_9APHY
MDPNIPVPEITIAQAPFDNQGADADIILRSSDRVDFYVHKVLLRVASSFFTNMFIVAANEPNNPPSLPIVDVAESSSTMNSILRICYPVDEVEQTSLDIVAEVLEAALKYEMHKVISDMKKELLTYTPKAPISVYAKACALNLEDEALQAAVGWRAQYDSREGHQRCTSSGCGHLGVQWERGLGGWRTCYSCGRQLANGDRTRITFKKSVAGKTYRAVMGQNTAGHFYRLIQFVISGIYTTFSSPPMQNALNSDDDPLLQSHLHDYYPFTSFPNSDITILSVDGVELPTHISILTYASASGILNKQQENSSVIQLDEDGRTLATLLQLCYPFADSVVTSDICSASLAARVRKTAEKYGMSDVARDARRLMLKELDHRPLDMFLMASRYGWEQDAHLATTRCLTLEWKDIEGPNAYSKEMEFVSAKVYYRILRCWYSSSVRTKARDGGITSPRIRETIQLLRVAQGLAAITL